MSNKNEFLMSRPSSVLLAIVLATGLSGCMADDPTDASFVPYSVDDRYPLGAAKAPVTMDVDASAGRLGPRQAKAIAGLAQQAASASVTPITVSAGSSGASRAVANQVVDVLRQNGVPANMINKAHGGGEGGAVRITFVKSLGASRECGIWDKDFTDTAANQPHPNHGCAVRANIAAMVADPEDLLVPNAESLNTSSNSAAAVDRAKYGPNGQSNQITSIY